MREENVGDNGGEVEKKRKKEKKKRILDAEIVIEELGNRVGLEEKDFFDNEGSATIEGKNGHVVKNKASQHEERALVPGGVPDLIRSSQRAISDKLSTRTNQTCCRKWYTQMTSSMVEEGIWAYVDDYCLLDTLFNLDACCVEDVNWDSLLKHRSGEVCRKRWD
ncbi:hypothetical protein LguiB_001015 [Lonicera macranthoides]